MVVPSRPRLGSEWPPEGHGDHQHLGCSACCDDVVTQRWSIFLCMAALLPHPFLGHSANHRTSKDGWDFLVLHLNEAWVVRGVVLKVVFGVDWRVGGVEEGGWGSVVVG